MSQYIISPYLLEKSLQPVLEYIFEEIHINSQIGVRLYSGRKAIVDYSLMEPNSNTLFYVEFNGAYHYKSFNNIKRDMELRIHCEMNNIRLIEIPYFVQLFDKNISTYFGEDIYNFYLKNLDKHVSTPQLSGFIDKKADSPTEFSTLGLLRFLQDISPTTNKIHGNSPKKYQICMETISEILNSCDDDSKNIIKLFSTRFSIDEMNDYLVQIASKQNC